jgi:hypothetical protein
MKKLILSLLAIAAFTGAQISAAAPKIYNNTSTTLWFADLSSPSVNYLPILKSLAPGISINVQSPNNSYMFYRRVKIQDNNVIPADGAAFLQLNYTNTRMNSKHVVSPSISVVGSDYSLQLDAPSYSFTGNASIIEHSMYPSGLAIK